MRTLLVAQFGGVDFRYSKPMSLGSDWSRFRFEPARSKSMNECRNCGSPEVKDLGFIGEVAPFFLKRVFQMELGTSSSANPAKRLVQALATVPQKVLSRIRRPAAFVEIQVCAACSFVQTKHGFTDESLSNLYRDYRSDTYNQERINYEPSYRELAGQVGSGKQEIEVRTRALTDWLRSKVVANRHFSMLDYGGADGRFLPQLAGAKYVFEISDVKPAAGIISIRNEADLGSYSYVQLAHVLEHVSRPREMVERAAKLLSPGGYLYIEVPQDLSDSTIDQLVAGSYRGSVTIHEHINLYTTKSITRLMESANLRVIGAEAIFLDLGWTSTINVRALGIGK